MIKLRDGHLAFCSLARFDISRRDICFLNVNSFLLTTFGANTHCLSLEILWISIIAAVDVEFLKGLMYVCKTKPWSFPSILSSKHLVYHIPFTYDTPEIHEWLFISGSLSLQKCLFHVMYDIRRLHQGHYYSTSTNPKLFLDKNNYRCKICRSTQNM